MGNLSSCCARPSPKEALLLDPDGKLWRLPTLVKAAEVMLEVPGHIVAPVDEIRRSRRIMALRADDELMPGKAYLAVFASRMNSKVDEAELAAIESMFGRKRNGGSKRSEVKMKSKGGTLYVAIPEEKDGGGSGGSGGGFNPQLNSCGRRQWNPVLEPILEDD